MPLPTIRIKYLLLEKTGKPTLTAVADDWGVRLVELSMCIRGERVYPELRIKIADTIEEPVEVVFGEHPLTAALLKERSQQQSAA